MGDFTRSIGEGISGLIGGSIHALSQALGTVVGSLQQLLPGPLFPITFGAVIVFVLWWLFKK